MSHKMKHYIIAGAAILTLGGAGSAVLSTSAAHAHGNDGHMDWQRSNHHWQDNKTNLWQVLQRLGNRFDDFMNGGPILHEHVSLVTPMLKSEFLAEPDQASVTAAVDANSQQTADVINNLYPGSHDQFLSLWRQHIQDYTNYLNAAKANDNAGKDAARAHLIQTTDQLTTMLNGISHRVDQNKLKNQLHDHANGTLTMIDAMVAGDWDKVYSLSHMGYEQMTDVTVTLLLGAKL